MQGPHFVDWQHFATRGACSMAAVPIMNQGSPIAALTISSAAPSALPCDDTLNLLAALVAPHVRRLKYTTRHMEVERLVQRILTPLAAELSVQQGRFKRVKNACGEDVLCLDESRGLRGCQAAATSSVQVRSTTPFLSNWLLLLAVLARKACLHTPRVCRALAGAGQYAPGAPRPALTPPFCCKACDWFVV